MIKEARSHFVSLTQVQCSPPSTNTGAQLQPSLVGLEACSQMMHKLK